MNDHTMRNDFEDAKEHARDALRATLLAARSGIDFVLDKLGEPAPRPQDAPPAQDAPPPPSMHDID